MLYLQRLRELTSKELESKDLESKELESKELESKELESKDLARRQGFATKRRCEAALYDTSTILTL